MKWPFTKCEVLYILLLAYSILANISEWSAYKTCAAPIQIFITGSELTFLVLISTVAFLKAPDLPDIPRKLLTYLFHWVLTPLCVYLPVQGTIWQIIDMRDSPQCPTVGIFSLSIWVGILSVYLIGAFLGYITYWKVQNWWKIYQFRRRTMRLNQMISHGEYDALNQMLLEAGELNDRVGLLKGDIEKLERRNFSQSFANMMSASQLETCPICCEDYKIGDEIVSLPKCSHAFHPECVEVWLMKTPLCPLCRKNVRNGLYGVERQEQRNDGRVLEDLEDPQY